MFENLTEQLQRTFKNLRGQGKLTEEHLGTALGEIREAMLEGDVAVGVVDELLVEFVSGLSGSGAIMGSFEQTQRLLGNFLPPEKVEALMEEIRGPAGRTMWDKLGNVNEAVLANYLKNEYPQTVAVILSKIKPDNTARVLCALPEDFAIDVVNP